jgi:hypothetical protein
MGLPVVKILLEFDVARKHTSLSVKPESYFAARGMCSMGSHA